VESGGGPHPGENHAPTPIAAGDGSVYAPLLEGITTASRVFSVVLLQAKPGSDGDDAFGVILPLGDIVFGAVVCWWLWWSGFILHRVFVRDVKSCLGATLSRACLVDATRDRSFRGFKQRQPVVLGGMVPRCIDGSRGVPR
jgi:hypothetical protein